jgi:hypothetical protein
MFDLDVRFMNYSAMMQLGFDSSSQECMAAYTIMAFGGHLCSTAALIYFGFTGLKGVVFTSFYGFYVEGMHCGTAIRAQHYTIASVVYVNIPKSNYYSRW